MSSLCPEDYKRQCILLNYYKNKEVGRKHHKMTVAHLYLKRPKFLPLPAIKNVTWQDDGEPNLNPRTGDRSRRSIPSSATSGRKSKNSVADDYLDLERSLSRSCTFIPEINDKSQSRNNIDPQQRVSTDTIPVKLPNINGGSQTQYSVTSSKSEQPTSSVRPVHKRKWSRHSIPGVDIVGSMARDHGGERSMSIQRGYLCKEEGYHVEPVEKTTPRWQHMDNE